MKRIYYLASLSALALLSSCGSSKVTNVWEYYVTNEVVQHSVDSTTVSKRKLLLSMREDENKSQFELIAVKQDSSVFLVIGSQKLAKTFTINDSQYVIDVVDVYPGLKQEEMAQIGDLSIYFEKVPASKCIEFLDKLPEIRKQYADAQVSDDAVTQIDFYFTSKIFVSLEKSHAGEQPSKCYVWVGKRKHAVSTKALVAALTELKSFN
jgi:hypothetical protein